MSLNTQPPSPDLIRGLVLGKFLPPHNGHRYLIDFARHCVDQLAVVVGSLPDEPIPGHLRHAWMQELFPDCRVLHLAEPLPQYPAEAPDFWDQWRTSLQRILPWPVQRVFASEAYGTRLAQELGATFWPLELQRQTQPISGTQIREAPWQHWAFLPQCVRPYFVRRVCVVGPESSGKSTLALALAQRLNTVCVPEYAEIWLRHRAGQLQPDDLLTIARAQQALMQALARQANRLQICDTELLTTRCWSTELYGEVPPALAALCQPEADALYLLCQPDLAWQDDIHRLRPDTRWAFFERLEQELQAHKLCYRVISGPQRLEQALAHVQTAFPALESEAL